MLLLGGFQQFPDLFIDRHEDRYLTERERAQAQAYLSTKQRRAWLLTTVTAKMLAQRYLSLHFKTFVPINALGVEGVVPLATQGQLTLTAEPGFQCDALNQFTLMACQTPAHCLCVAEQPNAHRTFGVAIEPIEVGFPFFNEDPLRPEEVVQLSALHQDQMNEVVATYLAVKRAVLAALGQADECKNDRQIRIARVHPTGDVSVACDTRLSNDRRLMAWTESLQGCAVAYVTAFAADQSPDREKILSELCWAATGKGKETPFAPRAHRKAVVKPGL